MKYRHLQHAGEFGVFASIIADEGATSYLEIGSYCGGSLWMAANALPKTSRIVAVDLPVNQENQKTLEHCVAELCARGYDAQLIVGDSTSPQVIAAVTELGPFDACFIDANHKIPNVTSDWTNYGMLSRIVGFHDISGLKEKTGSGPREFWNDLKGGFRHHEIKLDEIINRGGIGVLWRL